MINSIRKNGGFCSLQYNSATLQDEVTCSLRLNDQLYRCQKIHIDLTRIDEYQGELYFASKTILLLLATQRTDDKNKYIIQRFPITNIIRQDQKIWIDMNIPFKKFDKNLHINVQLPLIFNMILMPHFSYDSITVSDRIYRYFQVFRGIYVGSSLINDLFLYGKINKVDDQVYLRKLSYISDCLNLKSCINNKVNFVDDARILL